MDEFLKYAAAFNPVVTWVLVIIGWCIVSDQHNRREVRKEIRATIDFLTTLIYETQDRSVRFYMCPSTDTACSTLQAQILRDIGRIGMMVSSIENLNNHVSLSLKVTDLRRAITLHEFDQQERPAKGYADQRITEITLAAKELAELLEAKFREKYKDAAKL
jgi:hypothetical protein